MAGSRIKVEEKEKKGCGDGAKKQTRQLASEIRAPVLSSIDGSRNGLLLAPIIERSMVGGGLDA